MNKTAIRITVTLVLASMTLAFAFFATLQPASAESVSGWGSTISYPTNVVIHSCVAFAAYIYCVGGQVVPGSEKYTNAVYYATLSSSGVSSWTSTTNYPTDISAQSCVASSGYIFCIGGWTVDGTMTNASYYAPISSLGISSWAETAPYPIKVIFKSCATSDGFVYCVGGLPSSGGPTNAVYYASLSSSGLGSWTKSTDFPTGTFIGSCVAVTGYIYCVGGGNGGTDEVDYAPISSSGVSAWTNTSSYPAPIAHHSCVASAGYIYCIGGFVRGTYRNEVYYAPLSSSGIPAWTSTTSYRTNILDQACVTSIGHIYCVAGSNDFATDTNAVFYTHIVPSSITSATASISITTATTTVISVYTSTETSTTTSAQTIIVRTIESAAPAPTFIVAGVIAGLAIGASTAALALRRRRPAP